MIDFQTIAAIIFAVILSLILYAKRKNLETKFLIPYILYFSMYKTKYGLRLMDAWAKKYKKFIRFVGYLGILIGFIGMALISYSLIINLFHLFTKPEAAPGVGLVLPFKAKGVFFVPFFYWIISIFVIAVVHEFLHGLIARAHNLKVKSSGFAFVGLVIPVIPAAFVEPDEKELKKRPHKEQLSVFAAGPLANIITALLFFALASFLFSPIVNAMIEPNGIKIIGYGEGNQTFPAQNAGLKVGEVIQEVDDIQVPYVGNFSKILGSKKPGDTIKLKTDISAYEIILARNPENESKAFLGILHEQKTKISDYAIATYGNGLPRAFLWVSGNPYSRDYIENLGLMGFLIFLNLGIGLFNLVPIGPLDGGRMLQLVMHRLFDKEKGDKLWSYIGIFFLVIIFVSVVFGFLR